MPLAFAAVKSAPPHAWPFSGLSAISGTGALGPLSCELGKQLLNMTTVFGRRGR